MVEQQKDTESDMVLHLRITCPALCWAGRFIRRFFVKTHATSIKARAVSGRAHCMRFLPPSSQEVMTGSGSQIIRVYSVISRLPPYRISTIRLLIAEVR